MLAAALAGVGRQQDALDQLQRTTARRPPFLEMSGQLSRAGRLDEATAALEAGLAAAADAIALRLELGFHHLRRNNRTEARAMFSQALASAPERRDALTALAKVMALDGEYADAAIVYRQVLVLYPNDLVSWNNLGICLLELGDRNAGETSLRAAARAAPEMAGLATTSLAAASHGRFFLRPSAAAKFLRVNGQVNPS